jgi:hypothetical protein
LKQQTGSCLASKFNRVAGVASGERFVKFFQPGSVAYQHAKLVFFYERPGGVAISPVNPGVKSLPGGIHTKVLYLIELVVVTVSESHQLMTDEYVNNHCNITV